MRDRVLLDRKRNSKTGPSIPRFERGKPLSKAAGAGKKIDDRKKTLGILCVAHHGREENAAWMMLRGTALAGRPKW
jgi:hypothetical protein